MKPHFPLLALAVGAFAIGTSEFAPMGLLPVIATGVGVSIPTAGMLVTAYAVGVMLGAPVVTLAMSRMARNRALIALMAIFTIGNVLSSLASSYDLLLIARLVTSMSHGAFFGIGSVVASGVVPPEKRASAVATMLLGLTLANIGGVPAATWLGEQIGWRMAFAAISSLGLFAMLILFLALPHGDANARPDIRRELKVFTRRDVILALLTTVFGAGAMFTLYTYIAPVLQHQIHATPSFITAMLMVIGVGFSIGNVIGGRWADRSLRGSLAVFLTVLATIMGLFSAFAHSQAIAAILLLFWGIATFAVMPSLQIQAMQAASDAPGLASSVNIGAFNLGNALGAAVGGGVLHFGLGYRDIPLAGSLVALIALGIVVFGIRHAPGPATASPGKR